MGGREAEFFCVSDHAGQTGEEFWGEFSQKYEHSQKHQCAATVTGLGFSGNVFFFQKNSTSVVIGRYQNQFIEANVKFCEENNIKLVRRYRCGGAVYYDEGNFNFSILTSQDRHNRKENLQKLAKQLNMDFN
uniref:BPL/LPL catalytic domain-containing protein n=1 Tax=Meloidogyne enterolobii TaxID=390850 RepID=A0A6V7XGI7_MELEN|nr:unnamed protein product [Meloidogyne enterolobii]